MKMTDKKYFSVLGDSLSTLEGYSEPQYAAFYDTEKKLESHIYTPSDTWWGMTIEEMSGELLVNNSISGSTVTKRDGYEIESYGCSIERTSSLSKGGISPDVIMVLLGTNDWGMGVDIAEGEYAERSFGSAYSLMLKRLRENYPNAELWCFSLPVSRCSRMSDFSFPYVYKGVHIAEYCHAIRKVAKEHGARLIELYEPKTQYDTIDGFHPTREGMSTIFQSVKKQLRWGSIV